MNECVNSPFQPRLLFVEQTISTRDSIFPVLRQPKSRYFRMLASRICFSFDVCAIYLQRADRKKLLIFVGGNNVIIISQSHRAVWRRQKIITAILVEKNVNDRKVHSDNSNSYRQRHTHLRTFVALINMQHYSYGSIVCINSNFGLKIVIFVVFVSDNNWHSSWEEKLCWAVR